MFDIALDLHKENTYGVVLDDKSWQIVWEGNFASNIKAAKEVLEPYFVHGTKLAIEATSCFYPMHDGLKSVKDVEVSVVNTVKLEKPAVATANKLAKLIYSILTKEELYNPGDYLLVSVGAGINIDSVVYKVPKN